MDHNHSLEVTIGKWFVAVSPETNHGYFEHTETGTGGELWFMGKDLIDYDGVFELSAQVMDAIVVLGYNADYAKDES